MLALLSTLGVPEAAASQDLLLLNRTFHLPHRATDGTIREHKESQQ
jgi:hypothetical protein